MRKSNKKEIHIQSQHFSSRLKLSKNPMFNDARHVYLQQLPLLIQLFPYLFQFRTYLSEL